MSQVHEPTNEQLYETYPDAYQPTHTVARREAHGLDARLDRIEAALAHRPTQARRAPGSGPALALAIVSMVMGIPLTAIALNSSNMSSFDRLVMLIVVWFGIIGVNAVFNLGRRNRQVD